MLSWRLWRALNQPPPKHPLRRFVRAEGPSHKNRNRLLFTVLIFFALPALCVFFTLVMDAAQDSAVVVAALPFFLAIILNGIVLRWTLGISTVVGRLRARGLSEMLALIPLGSAGSVWLLTRMWLQREDRFKRTRLNVRGLAVIGGMVLIMVVLTVFAHDNQMPEPFRGGRMTDNLAFTVAAFGLLVLLYVDFMQTCVFAATAGIVDTVNEAHHVDARVASVALFVVIEALLYLTMLLVSLGALPNLYWSLGINGIVAALCTLAIQFALLIGGRELAITALWRRLSLAGGDPLAEKTT